MKWFVFWSTGSCNDGSCDYRFEAFDSVDAVSVRIEELKHAYGRPVYDFTVHVVHGADVSKLMGFDAV